MLPSCCVISARFKADQTDSGRQRNIQINVSQTLYQKGRAGLVINCEPGINFFLQLIVASLLWLLPLLFRCPHCCLRLPFLPARNPPAPCPNGMPWWRLQNSECSPRISSPPFSVVHVVIMQEGASETTPSSPPPRAFFTDFNEGLFVAINGIGGKRKEFNSQQPELKS